MRRLFRFVVVLGLCLGVAWSGPERRDILGPRANIIATPLRLDPGDPARTKVGALTFLGGVELTSRDAAFGGFSSLSVAGDRFTLLSDGGNIVRFRMAGGFRITDPWFGDLPAGPGSGWRKGDRDSESMTVAPDGRVWVGFEGANAIWRYGPGLTPPAVGTRPPAMREWDDNGGAESMTRLGDGRFLTIAETSLRPGTSARDALLFDGDPVAQPACGIRFGYVPPAGYDPSDATVLPDGRVLVLNRRLDLPFTWRAALTVIDPRAIRSGQIITGREIARLAPPLTTDNYEGVAITREGNATIVWLVSDDNQLVLQRTLLMKFRLDR